MRTIVLFLLIVFASCTATEKQIKPPMSQGESLYRAHCGRCHRLYFPEQYAFEKLEKYVNKYGRGIADEDRKLLMQYLKDASKEQK